MSDRLSLSSNVHPGHLGINDARRAGVTKARRPYTYKTARYKAACKQLVVDLLNAKKTGNFSALGGPVSVEIMSFWTRQHRSGPAAGQAFGDSDGPVKGILDCITESGIWSDDSQCQAVSCNKMVSDIAGVSIMIKRLEAKI